MSRPTYPTTIVYRNNTVTFPMIGNRGSRYTSRTIILNESESGMKTIKYINYYDYKEPSTHTERSQDFNRSWNKWIYQFNSHNH